LIHWRSDDGLVTAEFALTVPSFVILLMTLIGTFQLGMERISNQQLAQSEAVKVGLGEESEFEQEIKTGLVCVSVDGTLEVLNGYACAVDYRFSRIDDSNDTGLELFGN